MPERSTSQLEDKARQREATRLLHFHLEGVAVGLGTMFDPNRPYTYCRLCGDIYQAPIDRNPEEHISSSLPTVADVMAYALYLRKEWSRAHSSLHSPREHLMLTLSGLWLTPEATQRLAPYGVVPLDLSDETTDALRIAPRMPEREVLK